MPPVSERQRRAMYAAREGHSTLGIPKEVGEEFVGKDNSPIVAAGVMHATPDGRILFLKRADSGEWAFPGGGIEEGETPAQAAGRECQEEIGEAHEIPGADLEEPIALTETPDRAGMFATYTTRCDPFEPALNAEHTEFTWARPEDAPQPLHPGVAKVLEMIAHDCASMRAQDAIAFDRASVRSYDKDGRLHVAETNISKANVCPYYGREIPDFEALGLDPDRKYRLLRHPDELAKAAASFNNVPLLSRHVPVSADDHQPDLVIGSTGTDASFEAPYLLNSLVIWARDAIDAIESEFQKELSSAYRYRADMTPGVFEGEPYDGVMRDIVGNHVALVKEGRAGPDVVVGDSAIETKEEIDMATKPVLTRMASVAHGALYAYLRPKLAQDAKIDLTPVLAKVTAKNFKSSKPAIAAGVKKLAQDADVSDLAQLLDALECVEPAEGVDMDPNSGLPMTALPEKKIDGADATAFEQIKALLAQLSDVERGELAETLASGASDESEEEKKAREAEEAKRKAEDEEKDKDMVTKPAMDAAIAAAVKAEREAIIKNARDIREAERAVRPYVGELTMAHDSAESVYRAALKILGVPKAESIHASALPAILEMQPVPGSAPKKTTQVAQDAASIEGFNKRFPGAARIGNA